MRHRPLTFATLSWLLALVPLGHRGTAGGTVLRESMPAPSVGERSRTVRVYLPPSYSDAASEDRRYPTVYMLHGWPGSDGNLLEFGHARETADSLIASRAIPEVILVFPNGTGAGALGRSDWLNSADGRKRVEDYVTRDLIAWVDRCFRTIRAASGRGMIGISDGADGALNLTFKHPDLFSACGGHSGGYVLAPEFGTRGFLGPEPGARRILEANSPARYVGRIVPQLLHQTIYFDCGDRDESIGNNRRFDRELSALRIPHTYREFPGTHDWSYWSHHLHDSLRVVAGVLH